MIAALVSRVLACAVLLAIGAGVTRAQDATWNNPATVPGPVVGTFDFNANLNWTPGMVPTGTAFFGASITPNISFSSAATTIGGWTFNAGASNYTFTISPSPRALTFNGAGIVINGGSATINNDGFLTFGSLSTAGNATITNNAGGFLTFGGFSTAGNATITNNGVGTAGMGFFNSSTAGNANITNNGPLGFNDTSTAGNATITNTFILNFRGASTAGNANITNQVNNISFFDTSTAGNATITNNGSVDFFNTSTAGNATINNVGGIVGGVSFRDASTAGNATITNSGSLALAFFDMSTAGNATIANTGGCVFCPINFSGTSTAGNATITNNGFLTFNETSTAGNATITTNASVSGRTSFRDHSTGGNARLIANANGIVDFSQTLGPAGDKKVSAGSIEGAGSYFLGSNQLTVGSNNLNTTVSGVISDCGPSGMDCINAGATGGSLVKVGTGTLALTGTNTYTGATTVNAGTLFVNGSIANSAVMVNAGGTLGGNGIVGNTVINGGALAPGNSIGTLTVQGSLVFTAASSYMVEVSPANADRTNVTGTATLGGATVNASFAAGTYVAKQYTILHATGGVNGTFAGPVNTNLPAGFQSSLSYDANNAYLNLDLFSLPSGLNVNQQNVANALTNFFNSTGGIPLVFGALTPAGLTQVSGEVATGTQQTTFNAMNLFLGLLTDPFIAGRGDPVSAGSAAPRFAEENDSASAYAANGKARSKSERDAYAAVYRKAPVIVDPFVQRWSVWAAGYGGSQTTDGNATLGSNNTTSRIAGGVVGADYRFSPFTLAGFALAGGGTSFSIANGLGSGRSDLFQAGAFVRHTVGPAYISAALAYGWQDITTDRTVTIAGVDQLRAKFNANALSGRVEGGYRFVTPWMGITPYAAGQFTTFDLPAYAEQAVLGANTFALAYGSKSVTASRSELGLRTDNSWAMQNAILTLRGRFAWAHDFNTDRNIGATFQTLPGASFVVNGAAQAHDAALTTASAEVKWLNGWSTAATFEGEFSDVTRSYAGKGVVRYSW